jgi:NAD(P)-dependent dehydrogenase (short-subunit alcohol dehydrogenase family)
MEAVELDITDPTSINRVATKLIGEHPDLNVLINNAGIMQPDAAAGKIDDALMVATITTNLMGPIRMTSALIEHLKEKSDAVVAYTSSVLGFVPLAATAVYSSTKAAVHSYILSQRFMLRDTTVNIIMPAIKTARVRVAGLLFLLPSNTVSTALRREFFSPSAAEVALLYLLIAKLGIDFPVAASKRPLRRHISYPSCAA